MTIRHLFLSLGTSLLFAAPVVAQVNTYPLAPFRAGPVPVMLRVTAPPLPVDGERSDFSLTDLGTEMPAFDEADSPAGTALHVPPRIASPRDPKAGQTSGTAFGTGDAEEAPPAPGSFARGANKVPSPFLKSQVVAPHTPDVSVDLNKNTSVGVFGEMSRTSRTDVEANLSRPEREVGAGVTLQYKFGTH